MKIIGRIGNTLARIRCKNGHEFTQDWTTATVTCHRCQRTGWMDKLKRYFFEDSGRERIERNE